MTRPPLCRTVVATALVIATACATTRTTVPTAETTPSETVAIPTQPWVAILDADPEPDALSGPRRVVLRALGDALEGYVVISPAACLEGIPARIAGDGYVLAIQRDRRDDVEALASQLPREPLFVGQVNVLCSD